MEIVEATNEHAAAWDEFVLNAPGATFYHQYKWKTALELAYRVRTHYCIAMQGRQVRGVLPLAEVRSLSGRQALVSTPYANYGGILADDDEIEAALLAHGRSLIEKVQARRLELKSLLRAEHAELAELLEYFSLVMKLDPDPEVVWKGELNAKVRNQVRKAEKSGVTVETGVRHFRSFIDILRLNLRDHGTPTHAVRWHMALSELFGDQMEVSTAFVDGQPVAGVWLFFFRDTAIAHCGASCREHLRLCPNNLAYWNAIKLACERGCRHFDFARSRRTAGTFHFKKQWGATPRQIYYQYFLRPGEEVPDMNPDDPKYKLAVTMWRHLPLGVANWLGPILRSRIST
ncbi:MAG: FemAB family PEP-CTERM system-associated protein [Lentisphaeria bacterium]|jgi:FemAB-related protein (PEP-CTERM system-associated)|nr:FemAB family PEP-CTERM system-associated protein [Lentisphaeria bacterium]